MIVHEYYLTANDPNIGLTLRELREFLTECARQDVPETARIVSPGAMGNSNRIAKIKAVHTNSETADMSNQEQETSE